MNDERILLAHGNGGRFMCERAHAEEEAPNECCGVLVFRDGVAEVEPAPGKE